MPKGIFTGQTFCISGSLVLPRTEYEELIKKHGGEVASTLTKAVTILISTLAEVNKCTTKVATARMRKVPIVKESFITESIGGKEVLDTLLFGLKATKKRKAPSKEKTDGPKKARESGTPVVISPTLPLFPKAGLAATTGVVQEQLSRGFVKASLTWDVELIHHHPDKGIDRFYNMQLVGSKAADEFWVAGHWGRTGLEGRVKVDGPYESISVAKQIFRKRYRQKTGNVWGQVGVSFIESDGKYKLLVKGEKKDEKSGLWQYYMHNENDRQKIGWHNTEAGAAKNLEKNWEQFGNNADLGVRLVHTDYFTYEINFAEMYQTNTKSGTRRVIRRIPAGVTPSREAPATIPASVAPTAPVPAAAADDDSDEEGGASVSADEDPAGSEAATDDEAKPEAAAPDVAAEGDEEPTLPVGSSVAREAAVAASSREAPAAAVREAPAAAATREAVAAVPPSRSSNVLGAD